MLHLNIKAVHEMIASNENLRTFYKWVLSHSTSLTLPYHNLRHTLGMMQHIMNIYAMSTPDDELSSEDFYVLMVSALFHDFSHSGGLMTDKINVDNAIAGMKRCLDECLVDSPETTLLKQKCEHVIRATEYPYVIADEDLTRLQSIIRECDILVVFYDDVFLQNIIGLTAEMHQTDKAQFVADWMKFVLEQSEKFRTRYSKKLLEKYSQELVDEMKMFIKTIK